MKPKITRLKSESGQSAAFYALMMVAIAAFILGLMAYLTTNSRAMQAIAIADLAAHAGAQEITVEPDGRLNGTSAGSSVAASYFTMQAPAYMQLMTVACGRFEDRPGCWVEAQVQTRDYLFFPSRWITIHAIGYMANGVTRGDQ